MRPLHMDFVDVQCSRDSDFLGWLIHAGSWSNQLGTAQDVSSHERLELGKNTTQCRAPSRSAESKKTRLSK